MMHWQDVKRDCDKFLSYDYPRTAREALADLVAYDGSDEEMDNFGRGALHDRLEQRISELLGKESAVFMATGRAAQLTALKVWCERRGSPRLAMHPRCHLEEYEDRGYAHVYHLQAVPMGHADRALHVGDFDALGDRIGAIVLEIPLLALGCVLPSWQELVDMSSWARERGVPIHADGARLWEIGPHYQRSYAEIAGLFDTITVSFYKSLNAMAGGAVAGPSDVIRDVRAWQTRVGANPFRVYPMVIDALRGLDRHLHEMPSLYAKAQSLAKALSSIAGVRVHPNPPHSNTMQVLIDGDGDRLRSASLETSAATGLWLVDYCPPSPVPGAALLTIVVGSATLEVPDEQAVAAIELLARRLQDSART